MCFFAFSLSQFQSTVFHPGCGAGTPKVFCGERCHRMVKVAETAVTSALSVLPFPAAPVLPGHTQSTPRPPSPRPAPMQPDPTEMRCVELGCKAATFCTIFCAACNGALREHCGSVEPGRGGEGDYTRWWCSPCASFCMGGRRDRGQERGREPSDSRGR